MSQVGLLQRLLSLGFGLFPRTDDFSWLFWCCSGDWIRALLPHWKLELQAPLQPKFWYQGTFLRVKWSEVGKTLWTRGFLILQAPASAVGNPAACAPSAPVDQLHRSQTRSKASWSICQNDGWPSDFSVTVLKKRSMTENIWLTRPLQHTQTYYWFCHINDCRSAPNSKAAPSCHGRSVTSAHATRSLWQLP